VVAEVELLEKLPVAGPEEVSRDQWEKLVGKQMEIVVSAQKLLPSLRMYRFSSISGAPPLTIFRITAAVAATASGAVTSSMERPEISSNE